MENEDVLTLSITSRASLLANFEEVVGNESQELNCEYSQGGVSNPELMFLLVRSGEKYLLIFPGTTSSGDSSE